MPCSPIDKALLNPQVWEEMDQFAENATTMIKASVWNSARDGIFAANCLLHTGFTLDGPLIGGVSAITARDYPWVYSVMFVFF